MDTFGDILLTTIWIFFLFAYLMLLFFILTDLFRDHNLSGWWKAVWVVALIFFPLITALVYLIARGSGMQERSAQEAKKMQDAQDAYIRTVAAPQDPADQITQAKKLLDDGTIDQADFDKIKAKALA